MTAPNPIATATQRPAVEPVNPQKDRTGLSRMWHATGYSIAGLRAGRPALRARMADSALCDVNAYVQAFQALLQRMWAQHCAGGGGRLLGVASAPTTSR